MFEKTISKKTVYQGTIFDIDVHKIEFPNGKKSSRDVVVHGPAVAIVARHENGKFLFINQFRKSQEKVCIEVTAGCCDEGEDNIISAKRELLEETGYTPNKIFSLGTIAPLIGYCTEKIEIFFAEISGEAGETNFDSDEFIETFFMSEDEVDKKIKDNEIFDGKTLSAWMLYKLNFG